MSITRRVAARVPSPRSVLRTVGSRADRGRPHWAARLEDVKNVTVGSALRRLHWDLRLQPFHGYGSSQRVRVLAKLLYASPGTPADFHDQPVHDMRTMAVRGWRNFASQVAPNRSVHIRIGERELSVRADRSGIVDAVLDVDLEPGDHQAVLWTVPGNEVTADITVVPPEATVGLVSDIDDTVMVTWLPRPLLAFWNAFVVHQSSRQVVPGMPMLYQRLIRQYSSLPVVYLSTGAWNVFPVLKRFLYKNGYPHGPLLLTDWGPTNTGFFRSGRQHKERALRQLAEEFPQMRWILVGDDGQHDPSIYADFAAEHPELVEAIVIRQLTESEQLLAHGTLRPLEQRHRGDDAPLTVMAPDGHGLLAALQRIEVIS
ncbi:App1 family protein [Brachybacterium sp. FME24]|uniref:App1 family protein n=1 Tax=Brachybacterium sp. FME24 TaxID=2742605 RepID=UPI002714F15D|nr:phosphatase domain-containing protein [Brachybacterium sp. FME24]